MWLWAHLTQWLWHFVTHLQFLALSNCTPVCWWPVTGNWLSMFSDQWSVAFIGGRFGWLLKTVVFYVSWVALCTMKGWKRMSSMNLKSWKRCLVETDGHWGNAVSLAGCGPGWGDKLQLWNSAGRQRRRKIEGASLVLAIWAFFIIIESIKLSLIVLGGTCSSMVNIGTVISAFFTALLKTLIVCSGGGTWPSDPSHPCSKQCCGWWQVWSSVRRVISALQTENN